MGRISELLEQAGTTRKWLLKKKLEWFSTNLKYIRRIFTLLKQEGLLRKDYSYE